MIVVIFLMKKMLHVVYIPIGKFEFVKKSILKTFFAIIFLKINVNNKDVILKAIYAVGLIVKKIHIIGREQLEYTHNQIYYQKEITQQIPNLVIMLT
jgi:hypothetical protein